MAACLPAVCLADLLVTRSLPAPHEILAMVMAGLLTVTAAGALLERAGVHPGVRFLALTSAAALAASQVALSASRDGSASSPAGCLPLLGRGARAGVRLALLREDAACPDGAAVPTAGALSGVAALVAAVLVLAGHAAVAVIAARLVSAGETAWRGTCTLVLAVVTALGRTARLLASVEVRVPPVARGPRPSPVALGWVPAPPADPRVVGRRGPPGR